MRGMNRLFTRLLNFASRRRDEERLHEEMQEHIAAQTEENLRAGMTPEEARRQACLKLGAMEALREEYEAIVAAGLTLQVDDAWLPALWDRIGIQMGLEAFRHRAAAVASRI